MTLHGALHPMSDTDSLYYTTVERKEEVDIICEGCVRSEENNLGYYVRNSGHLVGLLKLRCPTQ